MFIPHPYFKNVPGCGDLRMEQVIVDYVYPLLSVLKDNHGSRYLCMCFDTRGMQQWIITPISNSALIELLQNQITLASPFENPSTRKILVNMNYQTRVETFQVLDACQIPKEDIPEAGEYLDAEPGEWDEYIKTLNKKCRPGKNYGFTYQYWSRLSGTPSIIWSDISQYPRKAGVYRACVGR